MLPFQLLINLGFATIPICAIVSFTFLGIEGIAYEIENPFGYDDNDLHLDVFCETLKKELDQLTEQLQFLDPEKWQDPVYLMDFKRCRSLFKE
jgi:putative membrane protein